MKYHKGDWVKIVKRFPAEEHPFWVFGMNSTLGKIGRICFRGKSCCHVYIYNDDGSINGDWSYKEESFGKPRKEELKIIEFVVHIKGDRREVL